MHSCGASLRWDVFIIIYFLSCFALDFLHNTNSNAFFTLLSHRMLWFDSTTVMLRGSKMFNIWSRREEKEIILSLLFPPNWIFYIKLTTENRSEWVSAFACAIITFWRLYEVKTKWNNIPAGDAKVCCSVWNETEQRIEWNRGKWEWGRERDRERERKG